MRLYGNGRITLINMRSERFGKFISDVKDAIAVRNGKKTEQKKEKEKYDNEKIGGYTREQYSEAVTALDPPQNDDFFADCKMTETESSIVAVVKAIVYISVIVAAAGLMAYFIITCANDVFAFIKDDTAVEVEIPEGALSDDLAQILGDAEVIKYPWLFKIYAKLKGVDGPNGYSFVAGKYTVDGMMNYDELFLAFVKTSSSTVVRITIPEGYTVDDIIELFLANGIGTREGFVDAINNYDYEGYDYIDEIDMTGRYYRLEGYLYPDTYEFYTGKSEPYYIYKLLDRFDNIIKTNNVIENAKAAGMTLDEALTIASIIEKEAYYINDYGTVSSVIHNRLKDSKNYPCLEVDCATLYAMSCESGEKITDHDMTFDSPYNTYMYEGLPPGPICNPTATSVNCAVFPSKTSYYYFVCDVKGVASDGVPNTILWAKTYAQHKKNIEKIAAAS